MTELNQFIEQMRATSSGKDKIKIIKESSSLIHKALEYTYNPFKQYYVTSKTCIKNSHLKEKHSFGLFEVLDKLKPVKQKRQNMKLTVVRVFDGLCVEPSGRTVNPWIL